MLLKFVASARFVWTEQTKYVTDYSKTPYIKKCS